MKFYSEGLILYIKNIKMVISLHKKELFVPLLFELERVEVLRFGLPRINLKN